MLLEWALAGDDAGLERLCGVMRDPPAHGIDIPEDASMALRESEAIARAGQGNKEAAGSPMRDKDHTPIRRHEARGRFSKGAGQQTRPRRPAPWYAS